MILRLLLVILVIYFGYHLIIKPLLRMMLQNYIKKMVDDQFKNHRGEGPKRAEGSVHVDYIPKEDPKKSTSKQNQGEYIDYEEIK